MQSLFSFHAHPDAQADQSLRWMHMSEGTFYQIRAHNWPYQKKSIYASSNIAVRVVYWNNSRFPKHLLQWQQLIVLDTADSPRLKVDIVTQPADFSGSF